MRGVPGDHARCPCGAHPTETPRAARTSVTHRPYLRARRYWPLPARANPTLTSSLSVVSARDGPREEFDEVFRLVFQESAQGGRVWRVGPVRDEHRTPRPIALTLGAEGPPLAESIVHALDDEL